MVNLITYEIKERAKFNRFAPDAKLPKSGFYIHKFTKANEAEVVALCKWAGIEIHSLRVLSVQIIPKVVLVVAPVVKVEPIIERIGDTLFIDGTPHVDCGRCGVPIRLIDSNKITSGYWKRDEVFTEHDGMLTAETVSKLILSTKHGCLACYTKQQQEIAAEKAKPTGKLTCKCGPHCTKHERNQRAIYYPLGEMDGKRSSLKPGMYPKPRVK